jgi:hypothetical protein
MFPRLLERQIQTSTTDAEDAFDDDDDDDIINK